MNRRWLPLQLLIGALLMFGFGYLLIPLYGTYSDVVSIDHGADLRPVPLKEVEPDRTRSVEVQLIGEAVAGGWKIQPVTPVLSMHPGEQVHTEVRIENRTGGSTGLKTLLSVVPTKAVPYLRMGRCFCFERPSFGAEAVRTLPVSFQLTRDLPPGVTTLTLSFSLYSAAAVPADANGSEQRKSGV